LGRDKTGQTYLDTLVATFIHEGREASHFCDAEADWRKLLAPVRKAQQVLQQVLGPEELSKYTQVDALCEMAEKLEKECGNLFEMATTSDGRELLTTKHKLGKFHFQL
jgi:hypothetical protein